MFKPIRVTFKRKFLAGLFVTIPAVITIFVLASLFTFIDSIFGRVFDYFLGRHVAGLGFISAVLIIFAIGIVATNVFGKKILAFVERLLLQIPIFRIIYLSIKQLVDAFAPDSKSAFKQFVIAEYPRKGSYSFGFLTNECAVQCEDGRLSLNSVFIPTNNLYLGDVVLLDSSSIIYTRIPIEEGIKIILSGGITIPGLIVASKEKS
jgi:uncharacterized membrane protein